MSRTGGRERQKLIVDCALESFGFHGYRATTLDEVAARAGVRKQTVLYYFPSKEKLFDACIEEFGAQVARTLEAALDPRRRGWDQVERVIRSIFRMTEKRPEIVFFADEAARSSPEVVQQAGVILDPLRRRALGFLVRGMRQGVFRKQDPRLLLFTLYTAVVSSVTEAGVLRAVSGSRERMTLKRREEQVLQFVRRALATAERKDARRSRRSG